MADSLVHFLSIFGLLREREQWRERVTRALAEQGTQSDGTLTYAEYLHEIGRAQDELHRGNVRATFARLSMLLERIRVQPEGTRMGPGSYAHACTLDQLGLCLQASGQLITAEARLHEALALMEPLIEQEPDDLTFLRTYASLSSDLGSVLGQQGKYAQAKKEYEQALRAFTTLQDAYNAAVMQRRLGNLALRQEDYAEARTHLQQALKQFEDLGEPAEQAMDWYNLGHVALQTRDLSEAERCLRESLILQERLGNVAGAANCCNVLAAVAKNSGRLAEAEGWCVGALQRIERVEPGGVVHAVYLNNLADLLVNEVQAERTPKSRLVEARRYAEQALQIKEQPGTSAEVWTTYSILAQIAQEEGNQEAARNFRRCERESYAAFAGNRARIDQQHGSLIVAIAQAAQGDQKQRTAVEETLPQIEQAGWHIGAAVQSIWAGERDWHTLAEDLDRDDALLILRVLETLEQPASTPPAKEDTQ